MHSESEEESPAKDFWSLTGCLPKETIIGQRLKEYTASNGCNHFFITSKTPVVAQALHIGRRVECLLRSLHSSVETNSMQRSEITLHGIGSQAIQATIELALHLQQRMYPGRLKTEVKTSTCTSIQEILSMMDCRNPIIREREMPRSAIHVKLKLLALQPEQSFAQ